MQTRVYFLEQAFCATGSDIDHVQRTSAIFGEVRAMECHMGSKFSFNLVQKFRRSGIDRIFIMQRRCECIK